MEKEEWIGQLFEQMDQTSKHDMRCIICNDGTRRRGIAFIQDIPTKPVVFAMCEACQVLPGWEKEADHCMSEQLLRERGVSRYVKHFNRRCL
jgi:hypothetical protein